MKKKKAFTLIELLVVVAIIALLISILLPSLSRARELSKRVVCGANMRGVGQSSKIYANDNVDRWPCPPFDYTQVIKDGSGTLTYTGEMGKGCAGSGGSGNDATMSRCQYLDGGAEEDDADPGGEGGTRPDKLSTTRGFWLLVRNGSLTLKQFNCPSSDDQVDDTESIEYYFDFKGYRYVSYGYQIPYSWLSPSEERDTRIAFAADKGPWADSTTGEQDVEADNISDSDSKFTDLELDSAADLWKDYNSPNHGGRSDGEGQNILFGDGHVDFEKTPIVGADKDNIYTWIDQIQVYSDIAHGRGPFHAWGSGSPKPGYSEDGDYFSTDSLVYP